ncbi:MAG: FG-GAP-like repeat-containing protein [Acidobacteriota bacterium]
MRSSTRFGSLVLLASATSWAAGVFDPVVKVAAGNGPSAVHLADVNGDGLLDVVASNDLGATVTITESATDGTFGIAPLSVSTGGASTAAVAAGDLDGAGGLDVVACNQDDVGVLLGTSLGSFGTFASFPNLSSGIAVETGDVDGDADVDVVATDSSTLVIFKNDGTGVLARSTGSPTTGSAARGLCLADLDGDGDLDAVVVNPSGSDTSIWRNSGTGIFTRDPDLASAQPTRDAAVIDLDGDADLDIVVGLRPPTGNSSVEGFLQDASGTFASAGTSTAGGVNLSAIAAGDFDGDGKADVAVALEATGSMAYALGAGDGTFGTPVVSSIGSGSAPSDLAAADIDADGDVDVVTANHGSDNVGIFRNGSKPAAFFRTDVSCGSSPLLVRFTDTSIGTVTSRVWDFGDGGTSTSLNPSHTYTASGYRSFDVTLTVQPGGDATTLAGAVTLLAATPQEVLVGLGPGSGDPPRSAYAAIDCAARYVSAVNPQSHYGVSGGGVTIDGANLTNGSPRKFLTGEGALGTSAPYVRGWNADGTAYGAVSFYAYGTLRYGVTPRGIQADTDSYDEILTTPGPGIVFGPHIRVFGFDGTVVKATATSYFAYGTLRYGANAAAAELDGAGPDEVITAPGAGPTLQGNVRGWRIDAAKPGGIAAIGGISFTAFTSGGYGATVSAGDVDDDGIAEILVGRGPGSALPADLRGFDWDGAAISSISDLDITAFAATQYGCNAAAPDVDGDAIAELCAAPGPDPTALPEIRAYDWDGVPGAPTPIAGLDRLRPFASQSPSSREGATLGVGDLGKYVP